MIQILNIHLKGKSSEILIPFFDIYMRGLDPKKNRCWYKNFSEAP
jgi:hypothetical protein